MKRLILEETNFASISTEVIFIYYNQLSESMDLQLV